VVGVRVWTLIGILGSGNLDILEFWSGILEVWSFGVEFWSFGILEWRPGVLRGLVVVSDAQGLLLCKTTY
jgi:hypothetical protein